MTVLTPAAREALELLVKVDKERQEIAEKLVPLVLEGRGTSPEAIKLAEDFEKALDQLRTKGVEAA